MAAGTGPPHSGRNIPGEALLTGHVCRKASVSPFAERDGCPSPSCHQDRLWSHTSDARPGVCVLPLPSPCGQEGRRH